MGIHAAMGWVPQVVCGSRFRLGRGNLALTANNPEAEAQCTSSQPQVQGLAHVCPTQPQSALEGGLASAVLPPISS